MDFVMKYSLVCVAGNFGHHKHESESTKQVFKASGNESHCFVMAEEGADVHSGVLTFVRGVVVKMRRTAHLNSVSDM